MLILEKRIGAGATRECYLHPLDAGKCVKIPINRKKSKMLERELRYYPILKEIIGDFIVAYDDTLAETNKGRGLVCALLRDDNGEVSKPITAYIKNNTIDTELQNEMNFFAYHLIAHELFFYDFNLNNFVIQRIGGKSKLKYIDLKSFENNKSWCFLKLENLVAPLARIMMIRRLKRAYKQLNILFLKE